MKLDLSSIINDLISGKARIRDEFYTVSAGAGAAIDDTFLKCPERTIRLVIAGIFSSVKTTGTALGLEILNSKGMGVAILVERTIGTGNFAVPTDDGSSKGSGETSAAQPLLMKEGDQFHVTHALTALETILHNYEFRFIEYTGVDVL